MSEHLPIRWDPYTDPLEIEQMPEIEHQSAREGMTGVNYTFGLRPEFPACDALDAPWLLPLGGVVVHAADNVADCFVERECDDDALILPRAAEIEAAELCRAAMDYAGHVGATARAALARAKGQA